MIDPDRFKHLVNSLNVLSRGGDLLAQLDILNHINPSRILELGAGNGDWLVFIASALDSSPSQLVGYDDFTWHIDYNWAQTCSQLEQRIQGLRTQLEFTAPIELREADILTMDYALELANQSFDLIRLDCLNGPVEQILSVLDKLLPYTHSGTIILVDDIPCNSVPNRFTAMQELVGQELVSPLWFGSKEGAWICQDRDSTRILAQSILDSLEPNPFYTYQPMASVFSGHVYDYITTASTWG